MITVSENKKYLNKNGEFYPYLADTAWTLLQRLSRDEIVFYLDKRKSQGFNAIQVSAISELDGINTPNREGNLPFINKDVYTPNSAYFELLSFLITECEKRELTLTLLPTWGDKFNKKWGVGPEIFDADNARSYGRFLAELAGEHQDIIFMLGGDRPLETENHRKIIDAMAHGIREGEKLYHLITFHPCGEASSLDFLNNCDYIDFHSLQSGHSFGGFNSEQMINSVLKAEQKPCLDAESFYEDFPIDFNLSWNYRLNSSDIRKRIYRNMFAGSLGTVYGHQSVWCFKYEADFEYPFDWKSALNRPMANEIKNITTFLKKIDITDMNKYENCYNSLAISNEKRIVVYVENQYPIFVRLPKEKCMCGAMWFDTVKGEFSKADITDLETVTIKSNFENEAIFIIELQNGECKTK